MSVIGDAFAKMVYRRLTNPKSVAKAALRHVLLEKNYDQSVWLSSGFFRDDRDWDAAATGTDLRATLNEGNVCGTTCCVAGSVVVLTLPAKGKYHYHNDMVSLPGQRDQRVSEYAAEKLGISADDANWLFDGNRTKEEVVEALELLVGGKSMSGLVTASQDWYDDDDDDDDYDEDDDEGGFW